MADMSMTIRSLKSDQLNAIDLMGGGVVVTIKSVTLKPNDKQSMWIELEENFNTFKPCLTMRRVIMDIWGAETGNHIGRQLVLFCDPNVLWGGQKEGGVRISHASHITETRKIRLRESQHKTAVWEVHPLVIQQEQEAQTETKAPTFETIKELMSNCNDTNGMAAYGDLIKEHAKTFTADQMSFLRQHYADCLELIKQDQS